MKYDPYGTNEDRRPLADKLHQLFQGEAKKIYFVMPDEETEFTPERYRFVITDDRFKTTYLFEAQPENFTEVPTPEPQIKICLKIPSAATAPFRRGTFLYSMELKSILGEDRQVLEEGSLLVEYHAGAPDPDVPYKNPAIDETQNYG